MEAKEEMNSKEQAANVAARIAGYQRMYGVNDEELAVRLRISRQTFSKRKKEPGTYRVEELIAAAKTFGITLRELIGGTI